jgi:prostaglandin-endoperoxide synthase 2
MNYGELTMYDKTCFCPGLAINQRLSLCWFTDSFLRTDFLDRRKNTSNHEIDLCQIYGLREEITHYLRLQKDGKLKYPIIDGDIYPPYLFNADETTSGNWVFASKEFEKLHPRYALDFVFNNVPEKRLKRMFAVGLEHGNSSIGYILNTLMLREHNRICDLLKEAYFQVG